jgi:NADH-quinone oxidoreductase subunit C
LPPADTEASEAGPAPDEAREGLVESLRSSLGDGVVDVVLEPGRDLWVRVAPEAWGPLAAALRDGGFRYFSFLSGIDWMPSPFGRSLDSDVDNVLAGVAPREQEERSTGYAGGETRFQVFARVTDLDRRLGVTLKTDVPEDTLSVATWTGVYAGSNWHERETWEMFGIHFEGHPNLRNIYLPTDFEGHPLRKDYPLVARMVKPWPGIVDVEGMPGEDDGDEGAGDAA